MNIALIFPGQGSQYVGMGKSLADKFPEAKQVFDRVDAALNENLSKLIWEGSEAELKQTQNAQPALMATSIAAVEASKVVGFNFEEVKYVAGHSLGEYSALCYSGAISLEETAIILRKRGQAMQDAVKLGQGAMAAIIGLGLEQVEEVICNIEGEGVCEVANDNEPKQVVISGHINKVQKAMETLKEIGARRVVSLPVSAPFHCSLMKPAAEKMGKEIEKLNINNLTNPLISNVSAQEVTNSGEIPGLLINQITQTVRWRESISYLFDQGTVKYVEFGAGRVLSGLVRRILPNPITSNVGEFSDLEKLMEKKIV